MTAKPNWRLLAFRKVIRNVLVQKRLYRANEERFSSNILYIFFLITNISIRRTDSAARTKIPHWFFFVYWNHEGSFYKISDIAMSHFDAGETFLNVTNLPFMYHHFVFVFSLYSQPPLLVPMTGRRYFFIQRASWKIRVFLNANRRFVTEA